MNFLTSTLLSGVLYDSFKKNAVIASDFLKEKLQGWLLDDELLDNLVKRINALDLQDYGEHVIERKLNQSKELQEILKLIKPVQSTNIGAVNQNHRGSGDNVINKTIYKN